jgi:hypothetical protein
VSPELYFAILSMDFYNRGYDPGIVVDSSTIGTASIGANSSAVLGQGVDAGAPSSRSPIPGTVRRSFRTGAQMTLSPTAAAIVAAISVISPSTDRRDRIERAP